MNEFLAGTSRCDEVVGEVEAEGQGSSISVQFGGNQIDVQIAEGVCDELPCAERAYTCGALDPSLGQSMSFPSLLQLKLRIEVPLWRNFADARYPPVDPQLEESDTDSDDPGAKERSPRYAQPVPVGAAQQQEVEVEEATEDEETVEEPTYTFAQGYGRFAIRYTRLATALGNFEQGNPQAESAVVAGWLTSGLAIAMSPNRVEPLSSTGAYSPS